MSGYIQWPDGHEFKPGDLMLNGGLFWTVDGDGNFRILDDNGLQAVLRGDMNHICNINTYPDCCYPDAQPGALNVHQPQCEGKENHGETS